MSVKARVSRLERQAPEPPAPIVVVMPDRNGEGERYLLSGQEIPEDELPEPRTEIRVEYVKDWPP